MSQVHSRIYRLAFTVFSLHFENWVFFSFVFIYWNFSRQFQNNSINNLFDRYASIPLFLFCADYRPHICVLIDRWWVVSFRYVYTLYLYYYIHSSPLYNEYTKYTKVIELLQSMRVWSLKMIRIASIGLLLYFEHSNSFCFVHFWRICVAFLDERSI